MLGWNIGVYRQPNGGASPAKAESTKGARLAVWQTELGGLDWIEELVKAGKAIDLGGNGYPCRYTATAAYLIPQIMDGPPRARQTWTCDEGDTLLEGWEGKTVIDRAVAAACQLDEWLLIEAWDES